MTTTLLSADEVTAATLPAVAGKCLPPRCFTSEAFFAEEKARIFGREWIAVGRADRLKRAGDYFTVEIAGDPLIITRDGRGKIRALANACTHRGSLLVSGAGRSSRFVCPYHGWTFAPTGELIGAPLMQRTETFDKSSCRLGEARVALWEGFVFVNLDPDAAPLAPRLAGLSKHLERYRLSDLRTDETVVLENACNWKIGVENAIDEYHAFVVHRTLQPTKFYHLDRTEAVADPAPDPAWVINSTPSIKPLPTGIKLRETSIPPFAALSETEKSRFNVLGLFPNIVIALTPFSAITLIFLPISAGRTALHVAMNYHKDTFDIPHFAAFSKRSTQALLETNEQDMHGCRMAQQGLYSSMIREGRLSYMEEAVRCFDAYIARMMAAPPSVAG